jgi:CheY-like chemotaxis protein
MSRSPVFPLTACRGAVYDPLPMPTKGTILVVDDSPLVLDLAREALEPEGFHVVTNSSWVEVNASIRQHRPDLILLDLMMPSIRGENLCEILKRSTFAGGIPIVLFSAKEEEEIRELARVHGADGWIRKRLSRREIVEDVLAQYHRLVAPPGTAR